MPVLRPDRAARYDLRINHDSARTFNSRTALGWKGTKNLTCRRRRQSNLLTLRCEAAILAARGSEFVSYVTDNRLEVLIKLANIAACG